MNETPQVGEESGGLVDHRDHEGEILGNIVIPDQRAGFFVWCKRENGEGAEEGDRDESLSGDRKRRNGGDFNLEIMRSMKIVVQLVVTLTIPMPSSASVFIWMRRGLTSSYPRSGGLKGMVT